MDRFLLLSLKVAKMRPQISLWAFLLLWSTSLEAIFGQSPVYVLHGQFGQLVTSSTLQWVSFFEFATTYLIYISPTY